MAYTKAQLEAIKNTLLASNQPILANQHREQIQSMIDEMYDAQSRADILVGVQADTITGGSDTFIVFRNGEAYQIPLSLLSSNTLANLGDVFISNVADGETLVYNAVAERWENQNIFLGFALSNLEDVQLTSLANGDILRYDSTSEKWENTSLATILSPYALLTDLNAYQLLSQKGQANGYAQLDSGAKLPISIIPDSVLGQVEYQGTWNAATNTPTLPSTPLKKGDYYVVSADGTQFGIDFLIGDWIISNGTVWEKVDNTDAVSSVFGRLGNIVANASDYSAFYVTLDTLQTVTGQKTFNSLRIDSSNGIIYTQQGGHGIPQVGNTMTTAIANDYRFIFGLGAGDYKSFSFSSALLSNNVNRAISIPNASGTLALTSDLAAYLPLSGGTLTGALNGTSASFTGNGIIGGSLKWGQPTGGQVQYMYRGDDGIFANQSTTSNSLYSGSNFFSIRNSSDTSALLTVLNTGNVGIGTTSPSTKVDVLDSSQCILRLRANTIGSAFYVTQTNTNDTLFAVGDDAAIIGGASNSLITYFSSVGVGHRWHIGGFERMRITSAGNVGIGTTSPSAKLHVNGNIITSNGWNALSANGFGRIGFSSGKIGSTSFGGLFGPTITYNAYFDGSIWRSLGGGNASAITIDEGTYSFANSQFVGAGDVPLSWTDRLIINTSGNVGIGTTAPGDKLEIAGAGSGIILASPNGTRYRVTVTDVGVLMVAAV